MWGSVFHFVAVVGRYAVVGLLGALFCAAHPVPPPSLHKLRKIFKIKEIGLDLRGGALAKKSCEIVFPAVSILPGSSEVLCHAIVAVWLGVLLFRGLTRK
jgi:hypothetical protein